MAWGNDGKPYTKKSQTAQIVREENELDVLKRIAKALEKIANRLDDGIPARRLK